MSAKAESQSIVVGYDGRPQARDALALGAVLASATGDHLVLAGAYPSDGLLMPEDLEGVRAEVLEGLAGAADAVPSEVSREVDQRAIPGPSPAAALQELAEVEHPRALVLGSCHRGPAGRVLMGSVAERLLHGSPCPVAVAPRGMSERAPTHLRTICVGFDGGAEGWTALQRAAQLGAAAQAHLRVVMALAPVTGTWAAPAYSGELEAVRERQAEIELERAGKSVSKRLDAEVHLARGFAAEVLAEQAKHDVDLLVVGSRGYGPVRRVLLGSVSTALMRSAPCPVMVVPRTADFQPTGEGMAADDEFVAGR